MASTSFLLLIKPDAVKRGLVGKIISRFEKRNFTILELKKLCPEKTLIEKHYEEHNTTSFFNTLVEFTCSGPVIAMVVYGNMKVAREIIGSTLPWESKAGSIRGDYSCSLPENLVHCSADQEAAKREIDLWFKT